MSRLGKKPVTIPTGAKVNVSGRLINVDGPKGKLSWEHPFGVSVEVGEKELLVRRDSDVKQIRAFHGLTWALINNMLTGVTEGFKKELRIVGIGWNAKMAGKGITLQIGFCHPVIMTPPEGVVVETPSLQDIVITGCDRQKVGQFAAEIRRVRPPEPYKQKGIRYKGEIVRKKSGKSFVSGG